MPVFVLEAFGSKTKLAVPSGTFALGSTNGDITLTINPEEMRYSTSVSRWRKRLSQRGRYPIMSTNFKFPEHKVHLTLRLNEEDLNIWKERSEGGIINGERQGIVFKLSYKRSRQGFADINTKIGWYIIENLSSTIAQESATIGASKGQLEWDATIDLTRVSLDDNSNVNIFGTS